jgi:hypothetical protein
VILVATAPAPARADKLGTQITFDIPGQPLSLALERYGDASGREVLYSAGLAEGRRSSAVRGILSPETALQTLLRGTGLAPRFLPDGSFVLMPISPAVRASTGDAGIFRQRYYARIQASLREALCANDDARPGNYRVAALLWIGSSGEVVRHARLGSSGASDLDQGIDRTLGHLTISAPPPTGFAQPVLVMIMPQAPDVTMGCSPTDMGSRHSKAVP